MKIEIGYTALSAIQAAIAIRLNEMKQQLEIAKRNNSNLISFWEYEIASLEVGKRAIDNAN